MSYDGSTTRIARHNSNQVHKANRLDHKDQQRALVGHLGAEGRDVLGDHLDTLLDIALEETFPASDAVAVSPRDR